MASENTDKTAPPPEATAGRISWPLLSTLAGLILILSVSVFASHRNDNEPLASDAAEHATAKATPADPADPAEIGASLYVERCALCHGSRAMGEGPLPLMIQDYPNTNLVKLIAGQGKENLRQSILHGGVDANKHSYSPPWQSEFSEREINGITAFLLTLQKDYQAAINLLNTAAVEPRLAMGEKIFLARCQNCHGREGRGDGPLLVRRNIKLRSDLTATTLAYEDILEVIRHGGQALGRSTTMPPWGQELCDAELASIARYVESLGSQSRLIN